MEAREDGVRPGPAAPRVLPRADRITAGDRWMRSAYRVRGRVLCVLGRHRWARYVNPEVGGPRAHYQLCRRCRRERSRFVPFRDLNG